MRVINLNSNEDQREKVDTKKKCPICSCIFYSTHRVSIHIYKHHRNLLGPALQPPSSDAKRLHEIQLKKANKLKCNESSVECEDGALEVYEDSNLEVDELGELNGDSKTTEKIQPELNLSTVSLAHAAIDLVKITSDDEPLTNNVSKLNSTF